MVHFVDPSIAHVALSYPLLCHKIQKPQLTICPGPEPLQTWAGERRRREWTDNPWSGQGLLSQWSRVLAHISWLLPGCLLTAISTLYSFMGTCGSLVGCITLFHSWKTNEIWSTRDESWRVAMINSLFCWIWLTDYIPAVSLLLFPHTLADGMVP